MWPDENISQHQALSFEINSTDDAEAICRLDDIPFIFGSAHGRDIDIRVSGIRGRKVSIWKTLTRSGFRSKPKDTVDVVETRLVIRGQLFREIRNDELHCGENFGTLIAYPVAQALRACDGTEMITCAFDGKALTEAKVAFGLADVEQSVSFAPVVELDTWPVRALVQLLLFVFASQGSDPQPLDATYPLLEELLIMQLLSAWPRIQTIAAVTRPALPRLLRAATEFIEDHLGQPITISDVAIACGVGVRTVQKAFLENFQCSPIQYIINQRLDRVHRDLGDGATIELVSQVAYRWGFTHMGDFSRRYKARFGETPSETRARRR